MRTARYIKPLTVTLTPALYSAIKQLSDDRSISMGEVVRGVLEGTFPENTSVEKSNQAEGTTRCSRRER
jgi:hypothetical protein